MYWKGFHMTGEIVKYHNDMNLQALSGFSSAEMDLLMVLLSRVRDRGESEVTFTFGQLRSLSKYDSRDSKRFIKDIQSTNDKLLTLTCSIELGSKIIGFALFPEYEIDSEKGTLKVKVAQKWTYLVNELITGNWTRFELAEFAGLNSRYAKALYRQLKQWKFTGDKTFSMEDFKYLLDIPASYQVTNIDKRVLSPCMRELTPYFEDLRVEKTYKRQRRGRPSVSGYKFTWKPEKRLKKTEKISEQNQGKLEQPQWTCPVCGETSVVELTARDGHHFWKCESCEQTFGSIAEVKGYSETPSRTLKIDDTEMKSEEVYIPGVEEINQLKKSLSMKSAKTVNDKTDEQKSEEHTSKKTVVNPVPVKHDITQCANPMARALDAIIWPCVEWNALDYPIIPKGKLRKVLGMDKTYSDEDLLTMLKEALSVLVDLGWYDDIQIRVGKYKNGHLKDVLLMPFVKIQA